MTGYHHQTVQEWKICDEHYYTNTEEKSCCIYCGLVNLEPTGTIYIRNITQYKKWYEETSPKDALLKDMFTSFVSEKLRLQILNFKYREFVRQEKKAKRKKEKKISLTPPCGVLYEEYLVFLNNNQSRILPHKKRKRKTIRIYNQHKDYVTNY
ncbi:MAG: hypothetical protein ACO26X_04865, partial [Candidatus Fonsibacter ubiquis]